MFKIYQHMLDFKHNFLFNVSYDDQLHIYVSYKHFLFEYLKILKNKKGINFIYFFLFHLITWFLHFSWCQTASTIANENFRSKEGCAYTQIFCKIFILIWLFSQILFVSCKWKTLKACILQFLTFILQKNHYQN